MTDTNLEAIEELLRERRVETERKREEVEAENEQNEALEYLLGCTSKLERENVSLTKDLADLNSQMEKKDTILEKVEAERDALKEENTALKMQQKELGQMSNKLVKETEHEVLEKMFRHYLNISRRKTAKKRGYIKMAITEMASSAHMVLPDDLQDDINTFDDDEPKPAKTEVKGEKVEVKAEKVEILNPTIDKNEAPINIAEQKIYEGGVNPEDASAALPHTDNIKHLD